MFGRNTINLRVYRANMNGKVRTIKLLLSDAPLTNVPNELRVKMAEKYGEVYQRELNNMLRTLELK